MTRRSSDEQPAPRRRSRAKTPEERESMLISMAMDRAEKQISDGTASSQLLTHFAKLGSSRERLEQERLRNENEVLKKKVESMEAAIDVKNLMEKALESFKGYSGKSREDEDEDEFYD